MAAMQQPESCNSKMQSPIHCILTSKVRSITYASLANGLKRSTWMQRMILVPLGPAILSLKWKCFLTSSFSYISYPIFCNRLLMKTARKSFCCYRRNSVANLLLIQKTTLSQEQLLIRIRSRPEVFPSNQIIPGRTFALTHKTREQIFCEISEFFGKIQSVSKAKGDDMCTTSGSQHWPFR